MIRLELPYPPSVNNYWLAKGNRRFISKRGRAFREGVTSAVIQAGRPRIDGRLAVRIAIYPPDRRKRDVDNALKSVLDALEHAEVFENDEQIDDLRIMRGTVVEDGAAVVEIESIDVLPVA